MVVELCASCVPFDFVCLVVVRRESAGKRKKREKDGLLESADMREFKT